MKDILKCLSIALFVFLLGSGTVWAQATAQINGTVKDQSGAVLPGVEITATQTNTGISRTTVTAETGSYVLPNLAVGPYRLEAALPGFRTYVQTGIVLQVNSNPVVNPTLEVGQVTEQVEVQANAALVETRNQGVGQVIENERILELPLNGRQATDLIILAGAAVQTSLTGANKDRSMSGSVPISVAGGLNTGTVFILDGAMHNDPFNNQNLPLPFPDALQEFKVETSALSAQYGMYSGASINTVTKAGTNDFHGDLFEFVRNDLFNARNYFATKNSTLKRHQFGGTAGGPIMKNRVFFFGGYQGTTLRQDPSDNKAFVPTPEMLAGDFTTITSPACNSGRQITLKAPFANNRIDPALFSKAAATIAGRLPKTSDPCGLVTYGSRIVNDEYQLVGRIDYQRSNNNSIFGRLLYNHFEQPDPYSLDKNLLNTGIDAFHNRSHAYAIGDTYLFGPTTINSVRLAVNRTVIGRVGPTFFSAPSVGVKTYGYSENQTKLSVTGGFSTGVNSGPTITTTYQLTDDASLVRGAHEFGLGANLAHWRSNANGEVFSWGNFAFNGQETGLGLADFLAGRPSELMQSAPNTNYVSEWYFGVYAADTWKLTPRLTFNYGLRWEPGLPLVSRNGIMANFSEERFKAGIKSTVFKNAPFGFYYPGDPGFPGTSCRSSGICNSSGSYIKWKNFAPRVGFAWDPEGNGLTSIRISYAMGYDLKGSQFYTTYIAPPWSSSVKLPSPPGGFDDPWQGYPGGNPFPPPKIDANAVFVPYGNHFVIPYDNPSTTRHSWNLSIQRQVGADWLASANYMGSHALHLLGSQELNPSLYFPGGPCTLQGVTYNPCSTWANPDARRYLAVNYPNIGGTTVAFIDRYEGVGTQSYNGLLLSFQRRAARGVTVGGNYTWSHCYGTGSNAKNAGTPGSTFTDPTNRDFDRGNCEADRRHIFNMTAVGETPRFANTTLRVLATGWRLSGIYRKTSGAWLTIASGQDRTLTGVSSQRGHQILENPYGDKSLTNYLNPKAFTQPAQGTLGNMRPGNVEGPATWQFDVAVSRIFQVRENQRIEVRAETYNVTNSLRRGDPVTTLSSNIFGQINTSADPRIMQFALKYIF